MRAILCHHWGPPESLTIEEVSPPAPGPGEVRIAVHAAGVNFADTLIIRGEYQRKPPFPFSPGLEAAGVITDIGDGVTRLRPGDRVMALVDQGAFAEILIASARDVIPIPDEMDFITGAAFGTGHATAHGALSWQGRLQPGETLMVHGAAGGTGLGAVEVGKAMGATVIATAGSDEKLALARAHGADHGINYRSENIRERALALTDGRGVDVVFDPVGGEVFAASLRAIAWDGRLIIIGFAGGERQKIPANILLVKNVSAIGFAWTQYRREAPDMVYDSFVQLFDWWRQDKLRPHVSHILPLDKVADAMNLLLTRTSTGKVVLTMGRDD